MSRCDIYLGEMVTRCCFVNISKVRLCTVKIKVCGIYIGEGMDTKQFHT